MAWCRADEPITWQDQESVTVRASKVETLRSLETLLPMVAYGRFPASSPFIAKAQDVAWLKKRDLKSQEIRTRQQMQNRRFPMPKRFKFYLELLYLCEKFCNDIVRCL